MIHRNALHAQLLNEINRPLIPHIQRTLQQAHTRQNSPLSIKYWITQEALDLFEDILSKVSGPDERRRAEAVLQVNNKEFWKDSRHSIPDDRITLIPLNVYPTESSEVLETNSHVATPREGFAILSTVLSAPHIPGLTTHTHNLLRTAASRGHTILTANKKSVKTVLRAVKTTKLPLPAAIQDGLQDEETEPAVFWVVEPRSLAELMRSDQGDVEAE